MLLKKEIELCKLQTDIREQVRSPVGAVGHAHSDSCGHAHAALLLTHNLDMLHGLGPEAYTGLDLRHTHAAVLEA